MSMAEGGVESVPIHFPHHNTLGSLPGSIAKHLRFGLGGDTLDLTRFFIGSAVLLLTVGVLSNVSHRKKRNARKNLPPTIPGGLRFLGNLLQLKEARPHRVFTDWAAQYGPIYQVKTGSTNCVIINSSALAKEATVTKFSSLSTRRLPTAVTIVSAEKTMVSMSDYGPQHQKLKMLMVGNLLGLNSQKANRPIREDAVRLMLDEMFATIEAQKSAIINVREIIKHGLFQFALTQIFGYASEGVNVPELGRYVEKSEMFEALVLQVMRCLLYLDWRNYFPALSFVPNSVVNEIRKIESKRNYIVDALIAEQRQLIASRGPTRCFCDFLLTQARSLNPVEVRMSVWEPLILSADTSMATTEWAMYEIARNPQIQERLYLEVKSVVGDRMVTEDDMDKLPLLTAVIQETLRVYPPVPMLFPRYAREDMTIGGYDIPKDSDVVVNVHGINMDPKVWSNPEKWDPDRLLNDKRIDLGIKDFRILPFGAGKRICAGMSQSLFIVSMSVAAFVLHSEWSLPPATPKEKEPVEDKKFFTTHLLQPLQAVAKPRVGSRIKYEGEMN